MSNLRTDASRLADQLHHVADDLGDMPEADRAAGALLAAAAQRRAPRRSGFLANHIVADASGTGVTVSVDPKVVPYVYAIHSGWAAHHIRANPFLTDTLEQQAGAVTNLYADAVQDKLDQLGG